MKRIVLLLFASLCGGITTAMVYAASVGPDAGVRTLALPGVAAVASIVGAVGGLLLAPLFIWSAKERNLSVFVPVVYGLAWAATLLFNLLRLPRAMYLSFATTAGILLIYRLAGGKRQLPQR